MRRRPSRTRDVTDVDGIDGWNHHIATTTTTTWFARAMAGRAMTRARVLVVPRASTTTTWFAHAGAVGEPSDARESDAARRASARGATTRAVTRAVDATMPFARRWALGAMRYAEETWRAMGAAGRGTARRRIYEAGNYAMERIDPREHALRALPSVTSSIEIVYPGGGTMKASEALGLVRATLRDGRASARNAMRLYSLGVPLSMPMFLTPLSNFPLYYFVYRLWGASEASANATEALRVLDAGAADDARANETEARFFRISRGDDGDGSTVGECKRLRPINSLNSDTGGEVSTTDEPHALACCRLARPGGETLLRGDAAPEVLFVPCDALGTIAARYHGGDIDADASTSPCAAAAVERLFGAAGVVELSRKHRRYEEIYGATAR